MQNIISTLSLLKALISYGTDLDLQKKEYDCSEGVVGDVTTLETKVVSLHINRWVWQGKGYIDVTLNGWFFRYSFDWIEGWCHIPSTQWRGLHKNVDKRCVELGHTLLIRLGLIVG